VRVKGVFRAAWEYAFKAFFKKRSRKDAEGRKARKALFERFFSSFAVLSVLGERKEAAF